jgi:malate synthase
LIDIIDSEAQTNTIDIVDSEAQTNLIDIVDSEAQTNLIDSEAQTNLIDIIDSEAQTDSTDTGIVILTEELNSTVTDVLQELSDYYDIISTSSELSVISDKVHKLMNLLEKLKNQHNM